MSGAKIVKGDKPIGNSKHTLHFIDKVLYPSPSKNIIEFVAQNYDRMSRYLDMSGLKKDLTSKIAHLNR